MKSITRKSLSRLMILGLLTGLVCLEAGCASIHRGIYAVPIDQQGQELDEKQSTLGMMISCRKDRTYSDDGYTFLQLTLENKSNDWIRIREAYVDFGYQSYNQNIKIISGQDLATWYEATEERIRVQEFNLGVFLAVLGTVGAIAAHSDSDGVAAMGALTHLGAVTSLTALEIQSNIREIESAKIFPESHLLAGDTSIPPGLFLRKFILFHTGDQKIAKGFKHFFLTYQTESGQAETVKVVFKKKRQGDSRYIKEWP
jgi:hypothetical protein